MPSTSEAQGLIPSASEQASQAVELAEKHCFSPRHSPGDYPRSQDSPLSTHSESTPATGLFLLTFIKLRPSSSLCFSRHFLVVLTYWNVVSHSAEPGFEGEEATQHHPNSSPTFCTHLYKDFLQMEGCIPRGIHFSCVGIPETLGEGMAGEQQVRTQWVFIFLFA